MTDEATARRKDSHLDVCAREAVEPAANRTLFDCVRLIHCALPELASDELDTSATLFGKRLAHPLVITGMTGGTERGISVNLDLAAVAEKLKVAFGLGSQRSMLEAPSRQRTFEVRSVAPTALVLGNLGLRQAAVAGVDGVLALCDAIGADGLALHLNPAQELTQPEGDRDFRGGYALIERLARSFEGRLLVKETGCGLSPRVAKRLVDLGVSALDVAGLGGTSWVRVEALRSTGAADEFDEWGIPTAAAIASVRSAVGSAPTLIASGGIRTGLDVAKALALGADLAGMALPLFRAQQQGGLAATERVLCGVADGFRKALLLTGSKDSRALRRSALVVKGELKDWLAALEGAGRP